MPILSPGHIQRFRKLRELARKPRQEFDDYNFSAATIVKWENSQEGSYNQNVLKHYIDIYVKYLGIDVTYEWLVYGIGDGPKVRSYANKIISNVVDTILEHPPLPLVFSHDEQFIIRKINPIFLHLFKSNLREKLEGLHLKEVLNNESFIIQQQIFKEAIVGVNQYYKLFIPKIITQNSDFSFVCYAITDDNKQPLGALNYMVNSTC